jgi:hypothetical protein
MLLQYAATRSVVSQPFALLLSHRLRKTAADFSRWEKMSSHWVPRGGGSELRLFEGVSPPQSSRRRHSSPSHSESFFFIKSKNSDTQHTHSLSRALTSHTSNIISSNTSSLTFVFALLTFHLLHFDFFATTSNY